MSYCSRKTCRLTTAWIRSGHDHFGRRSGAAACRARTYGGRRSIDAIRPGVGSDQIARLLPKATAQELFVANEY